MACESMQASIDQLKGDQFFKPLSEPPDTIKNPHPIIGWEFQLVVLLPKLYYRLGNFKGVEAYNEWMRKSLTDKNKSEE
jgi:hypothetical protein